MPVSQTTEILSTDLRSTIQKIQNLKKRFQDQNFSIVLFLSFSIFLIFYEGFLSLRHFLNHHNILDF